MRKLLLTGLASLAVLATGFANAADIAARPIYKAPPPPPPPAYNWTGFYVGGHLGGGWARQAWEEHSDFGNGFGSFCHSPVLLDGGGPGADLVDDGIFPICPFNSLANAQGSTFGQNAPVGSHNAMGVLGGFQAGFNWQQPGSHWVIGVEGQFSFADLKGDHQNSISGTAEEGFLFLGPFPLISINTQGSINDRFYSKVRDIGTIAARFGITSDLIDRTMFYVKAGGAYVRNQYAVTSQFSASSCGIILVFALPCDVTNGSGSWSGNENRWGGMVGAGLEFGLFGNWSAKIEYDYLWFGHKDVALGGSATASCTGFICGFPQTFGPQTQTLNFARVFRIDENIQLVKLGVNYRFDWGAVGPVSVGY